MQPGHRLRPETAWEAIGRAMAGSAVAEQLAAAARIANRLVGTTACSLYRVEGNRLALELQVGHASEEGREQATSEIVGDLTGEDRGAESIESAMHSSQLKLGFDPRGMVADAVEKEDAWFIRVPLVGDDGSTLGLYEAGPFDSERHARRALQKADAVAPPLEFALRISRRRRELEQQVASLSTLSEVGDTLVASSLNTQRGYRLLLHLAMSACRSDAGIIACRVKGRMEPLATDNLPPRFESDIDLTPGGGVLEFLPGTTDVLVVTDPAPLAEHGVRSLVAVPITNGGLRGIIGLIGLKTDTQLVDHAGRVLEKFAEQILMMMENEKIRDSFVRRSWDLLVGLGETLDARYEHTGGHHQLVSKLALQIAERIGLGSNDLNHVRRAGLVHDIGLSGMAEANSAYEADFQHPLTGAHLIEVVADPAIASAVSLHHEWYSGYGFPRGLKGDQISPQGYALATAEYLAESMSNRSEGQPSSKEDLHRETKERIGDQLHPDCGRAALEIIAELEEPLLTAGNLSSRP